MKKRWFYVGMALFVVIRLQAWRADRNRLLDLCAGLQAAPISFQGDLEVTSDGATSLMTKEGWRVLLPRGQTVFDGGRRVQVTGRAGCLFPRENPSVVQDAWLALAPPRIALRGKRILVRAMPESELLLNRLKKRISQRLGFTVRKTPLLHGFLKALWTGAYEGLPEEIAREYRENGLLHVIALSGQHVGGLVLVIGFFTAVFWWAMEKLVAGAALGFLKAFHRARLGFQRVLPLLASLVLLLTSSGAPSMQRTAAMVFSVVLLCHRSINAPAFQVLGTSSALLIIFSPALIASRSFHLSVFCTAVQSIVIAETQPLRRLVKYITATFLASLLVWPLSALTFGRLPWSSPLASVLLGWVWDLVLIPSGFLISLLLFCFPGWNSLALLADSALSIFFEFNLRSLARVGVRAALVPRPTFLEFAVILGWLVAVVAAVGQRRRARRKSAFLDPSGPVRWP